LFFPAPLATGFGAGFLQLRSEGSKANEFLQPLGRGKLEVLPQQREVDIPHVGHDDWILDGRCLQKIFSLTKTMKPSQNAELNWAIREMKTLMCWFLLVLLTILPTLADMFAAARV
jgi:hypothetical protein